MLVVLVYECLVCAHDSSEQVDLLLDVSHLLIREDVHSTVVRSKLSFLKERDGDISQLAGHNLKQLIPIL